MVTAVIGGTGFGEFVGLSVSPERVSTPWGEAYVELGEMGGQPVLFLPRHGHPPQHPPHRINYRANIAALAQLGVDEVIAITAVGGVVPWLKAGAMVMPDQLIDYSYGRAQTFYDDEIHHIDFTYPYDAALRGRLQSTVAALKQAGHDLPFYPRGVYGCTQGPRLETAAEIQRMARDGCTLVGMTAMPEAALAREKSMAYVGLSLVVNAGAGVNDQVVDLAGIEQVMAAGMDQVITVLLGLLDPESIGV